MQPLFVFWSVVYLEFLLLLALPLLAFAFGGSDGGHDDEPDQSGEEKIDGTDGPDVIFAGVGDDTVFGGAGNDLLVGGEGDDSLRGSYGGDTLDGSEGDDYAQGGAGNDLVLGYTGDDTLDGGRGDDLVLGEEGNDEIHLGEGNDINFVNGQLQLELFATSQLGDDTIYGDSGNDIIWNFTGQDSLYGGAGDDRIVAVDNQSADWQTAPHAPDNLFGGDGNDVLLGDDGDQMTGGSGADTFLVVSQSTDDNHVVVNDYNGKANGLTLQLLDGRVASDSWSLTSSTDSKTGDVMVGVANNADATEVIF